MSELVYREECYKLMGACFEVYNEKGCGFLESVYQECMEIEFDYQHLHFAPRPTMRLFHRGKELKRKFIPDFVCYDNIIVELKAVGELTGQHRAQVLNYLNATGFHLGLLVNFGSYPKLEWQRLVHTDRRVLTR